MKGSKDKIENFIRKEWPGSSRSSSLGKTRLSGHVDIKDWRTRSMHSMSKKNGFFAHLISYRYFALSSLPAFYISMIAIGTFRGISKNSPSKAMKEDKI